MSPTLFLIMFNDLLVELEKEGIEAFAYADDVALHAFDESKLNKALDIVEKWVIRNKMKINKKKSETLVCPCNLRHKPYLYAISMQMQMYTEIIAVFRHFHAFQL